MLNIYFFALSALSHYTNNGKYNQGYTTDNNQVNYNQGYMTNNNQDYQHEKKVDYNQGYQADKKDYMQGYGEHTTFDAEKMLKMVNSERNKAGSGSLQLDEELMKMAMKHSMYQASIKKMTHTGPYGAQNSDYGDNKDSNGLAENVAYNTGSDDQVMMSWVQSKGHYQNMINPKYSRFGCAERDGYWTQKFS